MDTTDDRRQAMARVWHMLPTGEPKRNRTVMGTSKLTLTAMLEFHVTTILKFQKQKIPVYLCDAVIFKINQERGDSQLANQALRKSAGLQEPQNSSEDR